MLAVTIHDNSPPVEIKRATRVGAVARKVWLSMNLSYCKFGRQGPPSYALCRRKPPAGTPTLYSVQYDLLGCAASTLLSVTRHADALLWPGHNFESMPPFEAGSVPVCFDGVLCMWEGSSPSHPSGLSGALAYRSHMASIRLDLYPYSRLA